MTPDEAHARARLRSEHWRRAHGIMPRQPAQRPWLADYRRHKQALGLAALTAQKLLVFESFSRAEAFVRQLQVELAEAARCHAIAVAIIDELMTAGCCVLAPQTFQHPAPSAKTMI